jgi:hypothetical protein
MEVSGQLHSKGKSPCYPLDRRLGGPQSYIKSKSALSTILLASSEFQVQLWVPSAGHHLNYRPTVSGKIEIQLTGAPIMFRIPTFTVSKREDHKFRHKSQLNKQTNKQTKLESQFSRWYCCGCSVKKLHPATLSKQLTSVVPTHGGACTFTCVGGE